MLEIQQYLLSGKTLDDLQAQYAIEPKIYDNLVMLNYNQIASPMQETICQECRALILEKDSWKVVSKSFHKFFNYNQQGAAQLDTATSRVYEKLDGSLICFYYYDGQWRFGTKGTVNASGTVGDRNMTFYDLVLLALSDMGINLGQLTNVLRTERYYSFELTTPENVVIIPHQFRKLWLLAAWSVADLSEIDLDEISELDALGIPKAPTHKIGTVEECVAACEAMEKFLSEGFVVRDAHFNRVKIKSPSYLMADRVMSRLATSKRKVELILSPTYDDVFPVLPAFVQEDLKRWEARVVAIRSEVERQFALIADSPDRKSFALEAIKSNFPSAMFQLYDHKSINEVFDVSKAEAIVKLIESGVGNNA